ncbi:MAG TPA: FAD-binding oxidoreductase [Jatrophihabitantaceae bacterium]|jgi:hypothetical protein
MSSTMTGCQMFGPDDEGYAEASISWNAAFVHRPAFVALPTSAAELIAAVRYAAEHDLPIAVQNTGHGAECSYDGALLINTSRMRDVRIDADARTARVGPGVRWQELLEAAGPHGLAGLTGTCMSVGVVGYTLGGGFGWLGRQYGYSADHVRAAEVVVTDGRLLTAGPDENAELFDALLGTAGTVGVVASLDLELFPVREVFGGGVAFPMERAREVAGAYRDWNAALPPEVTATLLLLRMPPLPTVPEPLAGKEIVAVMACVDAIEEHATQLLAPMRALPGAVMDTFTTLPFARVGEIMPAPSEPIPSVNFGGGIKVLTDEVIDDLVALAGAGSGCPCNMIEVRYVGGPRPTGARGGFAGYAGEYLMHALAIAPVPEALADGKAYLKQFAAALQPHLTDGALPNFVGDVNDRATVLRNALSAERYEQLVRAKQAFDAADRLRFAYPV